jgi:hypothetical protein
MHFFNFKIAEITKSQYNTFLKEKLIALLGEENFYLTKLVDELNKRLDDYLRIVKEMSEYSVANCVDPWKKALEAFRTQRKVYKKALKAKSEDNLSKESNE